MKINKILAIGAHFDDIEINCGGLLRKLQGKEIMIKMVVAADGEFADLYGNKIRDKKTALQEARNSLKRLKLMNDNLILLNYPESQIPSNCEIIKKVEIIIEDFKPDLILTHYINDSHQDHAHVCQTVLAASRYQSSVLMWESIFPSFDIQKSFQPQVYADISNTEISKIRALKCYRSQIIKFDKRGINWIRGIEDRARYRGHEIGVDYAEAFQPVRIKLF